MVRGAAGSSLGSPHPVGNIGSHGPGPLRMESGPREPPLGQQHVTRVGPLGLEGACRRWSLPWAGMASEQCAHFSYRGS